MKKELVVDIISSLFILLFLYTGLIKFLDHATFFHALQKAPLLKSFAGILSILVPAAELLTVASLLIPAKQRQGLYNSLVLMSIFTVYIGFMLYFRSDRPCTCGGIIQKMNWHQHFYFNIAFTLLAIFAIRIEKSLRRENVRQKENKISFTV